MSEETQELITEQSPPDFNTMSEDELGSWIDSQNGIDTPPQSEPEQEVAETQTEEPVEEPKDEVQESEQSASVEESPFYKGKSRDDLIDIIQNGTKKISQQENEINSVKEKLDKILMANIESKKEPSQEDDLLSQYDKDDVTAIRELVKKEIMRENEEKQKIRRNELERYEAENESAWKSILPVLTLQSATVADKLKNQLLDEIDQKGNEATLQSSGWVTQRVKELLPKLSSSGTVSNQTPKDKTNIIKRKASASTVTGSAKAASDNTFKGQAEPNDPDQYLKWLEQNAGLKI